MIMVCCGCVCQFTNYVILVGTIIPLHITVCMLVYCNVLQSLAGHV